MAPDLVGLREAFWSAEQGTQLRFAEASRPQKALRLREFLRSDESGTSSVIPHSKTLRVTRRSDGHERGSQLPGKGLVQQRLLQRLQRFVLPLVEARQTLGFGFVHG